ncbi:helix-turn-helix domain-containing protein [Actinocrispum sp. NPDC049592]|uniref:helix-turn-helix domain-containing protein n=1 Tax=Actinocrispum sp. NPDC049592 TaxID=3154835 RepID=UPI003426CC02
MKRAFKYRFYPTGALQSELLRTFGCVRLVHNLAFRTEETRANRPRFKTRKRGRQSAEPLPDGAEPSTVTVSRDPAGRWFVSTLSESVVDSCGAGVRTTRR